MIIAHVMQIQVRYLDNLRLEASFDDFTVITDQPIRYKGDGSAPSPFDYFLASSALCAAYFVKVYCRARDIPTEDIRISQDNIVDPENRYKQTFRLRAELPASISEKDRAGIVAAMDRCSVKRVIQNEIDFKIEAVNVLGQDAGLLFESPKGSSSQTIIPGKDSSLEDTITRMSGVIESLGIKLEIGSWRNIVPHVWSVHIRDADSPLCFSNGKGSTQEAALCSALGEYLERLSTNFFYNDYYLGQNLSHKDFVHYPEEKWFLPGPNDSLPEGLMDARFLEIYNSEGELRAHHLIDMNSGAVDRGICALPYTRHSDQKTIYIPVNLVGNIFVSNGMSAGNSKYEARVQALSEIFERAVKNQIIREEVTLPDIPQYVLARFPDIVAGIQKLEAQGFPTYAKDASLGGKYPVVCVAIMNPKTGGVFASFGAHPRFEVALERTLTELLQGRSFEGLNDVPAPTFSREAITEPNNLIDHFIDSTGVVSWKFFSDSPDYSFFDWDFVGSTEEEFGYLTGILSNLEKEVYIADYNHFGVSACRILVPDYSEVYPPEDLIWDNHNKALEYRADVLQVHSLEDAKLNGLLDRLEDSGLDDFFNVAELIGVAFDENSPWGRLTIGELKGLILLSLGRLEDARSYVEQFLHFNENIASRQKFYQLLKVVLDIELRSDLEIKSYLSGLRKMYGECLVENALKTLSGEVRFFGLEPMDLDLSGSPKHFELLKSYLKIYCRRQGDDHTDQVGNNCSID